MPNPLPGMDPYLEGEMWVEFHQELAHAIKAQLLPRLRPKYVALLAKHYAFDYSTLEVATTPQKVVYPDIHVTRLRETAAFQYAPSSLIAPVELTNPLPESVPLLGVEIRDVAQRELVTVIEILSPVNKYGKGAEDYAEKRFALLQTQTHLLEIDLLRRGTRIELIGELPPAAYYIYLSRWNRRPRTEVWPIALRDRLPTVPVPLLRPDADVPLELQAAFTDGYELVGYEQLLNYREPLHELSAEDVAWVQTRLHEAGLGD